MKVISIWQPYASLIIENHKFIETRSWAAPKSLIGQRIGIASTKTIKPEQRLLTLDPDFDYYYSKTRLPDLDDLVHGAILGTVILHSCDVITEEDLEEITEEEQTFGVFTPGRYAWRLRQPIKFEKPIYTRGYQGIWEWNEPGGNNVVPLARHV